MRVLLYVEPHPIRNSYSHFDDIARRFLPLLVSRGDLDIRMFSNAKTFEKVGKEKTAPFENRLIYPTSEEEKSIAQYMCDWHQDGIPLWLDLLQGQEAVTETYLAMLRRIWRIFPFDMIVHWGENGAVTRFLDERPVTRIAMELGCTRAPFFESAVLDPFGTNGSGVVPKLSISDIREIVGGQPMSGHEAIMGYSQNLETLPYEQQFSIVPLELSGRLFKTQKLVFLPLQLYDDANLLRFSPYQTLTDVVLDVVPKLAAKGYKVMIKPHPASKYRPNATIANSLAQAALREWSDNVIWCERQDQVYSNTQLIRISDFVVTVNSSVGFEALYFDKPVIVLGDAVYKPKNLFPTLDQIIDGDFDYKVYQANIGYLRRFFLGGYLQPENIRSDAALFDERLSLIHGLLEQYPNDPLAFARHYWRSISPGRQALARAAMFAGRSRPGQGEFGIPQLALQNIANAPVVNSDMDVDCFPYRACSVRLLAASKAQDTESFDLWFDALLEEQDGIARFVHLADLLDTEYYTSAYEDIRTAHIDPIEHYTSWGIVEGRAPSASIPGAPLEEAVGLIKRAVEAILQENPLADFPLSAAEEDSRQQQIASIRSGLANSQNKIAVVAHLYYLDLVPELIENLRAIPETFDLIVTLPNWGTRRIIEAVREAYPNAIMYEAANRGRDIGPFMEVLPLLIERKYDAVLKIQTKRGYYVAGRLIPEMGDLWRKETFDALLGSPERITEILSMFRTEPNINIVGPAPYFLSLEQYPYHDQGYLAQLLLEEEEGTGFFAGTMFWIRPECLRVLAEVMSITNFAPETGANDGVIAHLVERLFGHAAVVRGGQICGAPVDPREKINTDLEILPIRIHDYLVQSLQSQKQDILVRKEALAW